VIFGVAVVFPVVITFGVDKHRPLCTGEQRSRSSGGNVASIYNSVCRQRGRWEMVARISAKRSGQVERDSRGPLCVFPISSLWMRLQLISTASSAISAAAAAAAAHQATDERVHGVGARGTTRHLKSLSGHAQFQHQ